MANNVDRLSRNVHRIVERADIQIPPAPKFPAEAVTGPTISRLAAVARFNGDLQKWRNDRWSVDAPFVTEAELSRSVTKLSDEQALLTTRLNVGLQDLSELEARVTVLETSVTNIDARVTILESAVGTAIPHTILDATVHTDSVTQTVTRGALIYGNATSKWDLLTIGPPGTYVRSDGTDTAWSSVVATEITGILPVSSGGTNTGSWTAGSVIFAGAGGTSLAEDNANLFWDNSNNRLGVGMNSPLFPLHVGVGLTTVANNLAYFTVTRTAQGPLENVIEIRMDANPASYSANSSYTGMDVNCDSKASNTVGMGGLTGLNFKANHRGTGTADTAYGVKGASINIGAGTITDARGFSSRIRNLNAGGTIVTGYNYYVETPSLTGAITNQYGLYLNNMGGANATNIYGIYNVGQSGASTLNYFIYSVSGLSYFGGNVGVGTATPVTELAVASTSASDPRGIMTAQYSTDAVGARLHFRKARGTETVPVVIVTGDVLGRIRFSGYDGANYLQMASIDVGSSGTIASTRVPTYMAFSTATDAAPSVLTEAMRITNAQRVGIGTTAPATIFHISNATSPTLKITDSDFGTGIADGLDIQMSGAQCFFWNYENGRMAFATNNAERWNITTAGIWQSSGAQTIQTSTGLLTISTAAGNGSIALMPHGTGSVGVGTAAPGALLDVGLAGTRLGVIRVAGSTSGNVTIQPAAIAGTWTLTLPTTDGNANDFLLTDGAGVTSWSKVALTSGVSGVLPTANGGTNHGNFTASSVLFAGPGGLSIEETNNSLFWDYTLFRLGVGNGNPQVLLDLGLAGTTAGIVRMAGLTSGNVTIQTAAIAGTWTLTLPTDDGNLGDLLTTNGSGVSSWVAPSAGVTFDNPTALVSTAAVNGVATTAMRSDAAPAIDQAMGPTWTGGHTWDLGTSAPSDDPLSAISLSATALGAAGFRDSHAFAMIGRSFDASPHSLGWRQWVNVTSNAGASSWVLQRNIDLGAYVTKLRVYDTGLVEVGPDAVGVTQSDTYGLAIVNVTPAAAGAANQQWSGPMRWEGQGWETAVGTSMKAEFRQYIAPVQGTAAPTVYWVMEHSVNDATYVEILRADSTGFVRLLKDAIANPAQNANTSFGLQITNTTLAVAGTQQQSPVMILTGSGYHTTTGAGPDTVSFRQQVVPVEGTSAVGGYWRLDSKMGGSSYTSAGTLMLNDVGGMSLGAIHLASAIPFGVMSVQVGYRIAGGAPTVGHFLRSNGTHFIDGVIGAGDVPSAAMTHVMLNTAVHTDTLTAAVARGALIVANATPLWARLVVDTANRVLTNNGTDTAWGKVDLAATTNVTGVLGISNGGTNASDFAAANGIVYNDSTDSFLTNSTLLTFDDTTVRMTMLGDQAGWRPINFTNFGQVVGDIIKIGFFLTGTNSVNTGHFWNVGKEQDWSGVASTRDSYCSFETVLDNLASQALLIRSSGSIVCGKASNSPTRTDDFLLIASSAGNPTGVATEFSNRVPITYDTTNNTLCAYNPTDNTWRTVALA